MENLDKALMKLLPNGGWSCSDSYESIVLDEGIVKPSLEEINNALHLVESEKYRAQRAQEYPAIGEQLDAILKYFDALQVPLPVDMQNIIDNWKNTKSKFPKTI